MVNGPFQLPRAKLQGISIITSQLFTSVDKY